MPLLEDDDREDRDFPVALGEDFLGDFDVDLGRYFPLVEEVLGLYFPLVEEVLGLYLVLEMDGLEPYFVGDLTLDDSYFPFTSLPLSFEYELPLLIRFEYLNAFFAGDFPVLEYLYTAPFFVSEIPVGDLIALYFLPTLKPFFLYATVLPLALITLILSMDGLIFGAKPLERMAPFLRMPFFNATFLMCDEFKWCFLIITVALE